MDVGDLLTLLGDIEVGLAPGAERLARERGAGMAVVHDLRVQIPPPRALPEPPFVEPLIQGLLSNLTNFERMQGIMVTQ
jgi:hypothetical protein